MGWSSLVARPFSCSIAPTWLNALGPSCPRQPLAVHWAKDLVAAGSVNCLALAGLSAKRGGDALHPVSGGSSRVEPQATGLAAVGPGAPIAPDAIPRASGRAAFDGFL